MGNYFTIVQNKKRSLIYLQYFIYKILHPVRENEVCKTESLMWSVSRIQTDEYFSYTV